MPLLDANNWLVYLMWVNDGAILQSDWLSSFQNPIQVTPWNTQLLGFGG